MRCVVIMLGLGLGGRDKTVDLGVGQREGGTIECTENRENTRSRFLPDHALGCGIVRRMEIEMGQTAIETWTTIGGRFSRLLASGGSERPSYDRSILETADCVVVPTLGPILPNWLLVVPYRPAGNFRDWSDATQKDVSGLISEILEGLKISSDRAIWFEHGPSASGSPVGCGIDYAHIHVLVDPPFSFDQFVSSVVSASTLDWRRSAAMVAYRSIDRGSSYFVAGSEHAAVIAEHVEIAGSQFFRRVVAQLVDKPEQWNYNDYPHLHNVQATINRFAPQSALTAVS